MKKLLALVLALCLCFTTAACAPAADTSAAAGSASAAGTETAALNVWAIESAAITDYATNGQSRWMEQQTGVSVNWMAVPAQGWYSAFQASVMAEEDVDVYLYPFDTMEAEMLGSQMGCIIPLEDLITPENTPNLWAMLQEDKPLKRTSCCLLVDKEEIGSVGATGMQAHFFENVVAELIALTQGESFLATRRCLRNSKMLSSDVSAGYDPLYADAFEKRSSAFLSRGMTFNKFTGSRGKSGSNDANAEYVARIRAIMDEANVSCQFCELGKVDVGGGGTIAYIMAKYGMEVIDSGVALLSMHAPYEVSSKADVYEAYRGYRAFLQKA